MFDSARPAQATARQIADSAGKGCDQPGCGVTLCIKQVRWLQAEMQRALTDARRAVWEEAIQIVLGGCSPERYEWNAVLMAASEMLRQRAAQAPRACCEPTPDRSGRICDKPKGHDGDHWTYGGDTLTWRAAQEADPTCP